MSEQVNRVIRNCAEIDKCMARLEGAAQRLEHSQDLTSIDLMSVIMRLTALERRVTEVLETLKKAKHETDNLPE